MPSPADLIAKPETTDLPEGPREAVIDSEPSGPDQAVWVVIPSFDPELRFGPCPWSPMIASGDEYLTPSRGDRALVSVTEEGEAWVVAWWPYD